MGFAQTKMVDVSRDNLVSDFSELGSITKIAKKYDVSKNTIIYYFKKLDIQYNTKIRNYGVNHHFFQQDNEETFYWAGFLAADGCISFRKHFNNKNVILNLGEKDLDHLLKFKETVKSNHPVKERVVKNSLLNKNWNDRKMYNITIGSHKMVSDLERFNIVPRKTKTYDFPEWLIDHPLVHHFMRGYFDGDGCFHKINSNRKTKQHTMSIAGNLSFLNTYSNIINNKLSIKNRNINSNGTMQVLTYGGNVLTSKVGLLLYGDMSICLKRKYNMWKEFYDQYSSR